MSGTKTVTEPWKGSNGKEHTVKEADDVAHEALELAKKLEANMVQNPLQYIKGQKVASWFGVYFGGLLAISCLIATTVSLVNQLGAFALPEHKFLAGGLMIGSSIGLMIYFIALSSIEFLGNNLIYVSLMLGMLSLGVAIFMTIIAMNTRSTHE